MRFYLLFLFLTLFNLSFSQTEVRIEPSNWWAGMYNNHLQLMIHGNEVGEMRVSFAEDDIKVIRNTSGESIHYLFVDLDITKTAAGTKQLILTGKTDTIYMQYDFLERKRKPNQYIGFDASDVLYLITPDRFANGDPSNDNNNKLLESTIDRADDYGRHGGDIRGIINHLDYIADMGFTAIWPNPLLINDMPESSYHGYAITDFYKVDPRFGTLDEYKELCDKAREKGLKVIMDMVANHCGREHWWMNDLPFADWVSFHGHYVNTNHRRTVNQDPYASQADKDLMRSGWFVKQMPDLNQRNPYLAIYLIQNSIWWIETLGLGGIRQDTYPYPDKDFMAAWAGAIMEEYPHFNIVGEEWSYNPLLVGYWQDSERNADGYRSYLKTTMDFPMQKNINDGLNEPETWDQGLVKIYEGLANDFYYPNPKSILLFGDNHDMSRIYTQLGEDPALTKIAMGMVLTFPRIAQVYYGTEILMSDSEKPGDHGLIRSEMPGGWPDSKANAFTGEGLTFEQKSMQDFLKKVLTIRKNHLAFSYGETKHFAPEDGTYVYFRYDSKDVFMIVVNKNESSKMIYLDRFREVIQNRTKGRELISDVPVILQESIYLEPKSFKIFKLS